MFWGKLSEHAASKCKYFYMLKLRIQSSLIVLIVFINIFSGGQSAYASSPKLPCRIEVSIAHISKDLWIKTGKRAVKVDAFSRCQSPQSKVTLTVELWKTGEFITHLVYSTTKRSVGITSPRDQVENFDTYVYCKNRETTSYYGIAYSKAFIEGKWQYARHVLSRIINSIDCGT
jgi:hypothetical protein